MKYSNEAVTVDMDVKLTPLVKNAVDIYKYCNTRGFNYGPVFECFLNTLNMIADAHKLNRFEPVPLEEPLEKLPENNKILVLFSGGLDSVYQAMKLREKGYEAVLFHMKNQNKYTNGQEKKVSEEFAKKYGFNIVFGNFTASNDETYKKYWQENSWKNFLLYTLAYEYCVEHGIGNISSGDDLRLNTKDAVVGTNLSDSSELTKTFMKDMGISFIPCDGDKETRLRYIFDNHLENDYYSCVSPGRMNKYWHDQYSEKLGIRAEKYSCLICRKCAMHLLLRKYYLKNLEISEKSEKYLWERLSKGADNVFFDLSIPLETRIKILKDY